MGGSVTDVAARVEVLDASAQVQEDGAVNMEITVESVFVAVQTTGVVDVAVQVELALSVNVEAQCGAGVKPLLETEVQCVVCCISDTAAQHWEVAVVSSETQCDFDGADELMVNTGPAAIIAGFCRPGAAQLHGWHSREPGSQQQPTTGGAFAEVPIALRNLLITTALRILYTNVMQDSNSLMNKWSGVTEEDLKQDQKMEQGQISRSTAHRTNEVQIWARAS